MLIIEWSKYEIYKNALYKILQILCESKTILKLKVYLNIHIRAWDLGNFHCFIPREKDYIFFPTTKKFL